MKTKKIIKRFTCTIKIADMETTSIFTAIVRASYSQRFILEVESRQYESGKLKTTNNVKEYFETGAELKQEFEYNFMLCKNNLYTTSIIINI